MKKAICSFIYYKLLGWKTKVSAPDYDKYIICAAPVSYTHLTLPTT